MAQTYSQNVAMMSAFVNQVFHEYGAYAGATPIQPPKISVDNGEPGHPLDTMIDAHWKAPSFEMLLTLEEGTFYYYADDYKGREFRSNDADPIKVANVLYLLSKPAEAK